MNITAADIKRLAPRAADWIVDGLVDHQGLLDNYGINTPRRLQHFMAQTAQESDGFKTAREYASGAAYEGRDDLGNKQPGDGRRFRGRGLIQTTGRYNHQILSERTGVDYVSEPERLEQFPDALISALDYWKRKNINSAADKDDIVRVTRLVNGGTNGLKDRKIYLARAKKIWPADREEEGEMARVPAAAIGGRVRMDKVWARKSGKMRQLQEALYEKGYTEVGHIDGKYGPRTEAAVRVYFKERNSDGKW